MPQCKNVERKIEACWFNHHCSGQIIKITYSECVFVASVIQNAMPLHTIVICDLSGCTIFFSHCLINGKIFEKKIIDHKMCVLMFSTNVVRNISYSKKK
jgi:hypothetical protein